MAGTSSSRRWLGAAAAGTAALLLAPVEAFVGSPASAVGATCASPPHARRTWAQRPPAPLRVMSIASTDAEDSILDLDDANVASAISSLTEGPAFSVLQGVYAVAVAALADAAFSGDWVARGVISSEVAEAAATAFYTVAGSHVLLAAAAGALAQLKGREVLPAAALTLATGGLGFLKEAGALDADAVRARDAAIVPPLSMEINTLTMAERTSPSGVLLSVSVRARKGSEYAMRSLLETLAADVRGGNCEDCYTITVNQDPEDRTNFFMMQRFPSPAAMQRHQQSLAFKAFTKGATPLIAEPMGLYVVNERSGKLEESVYPFGPGGEGGRDDAIYSSPTNVQGSLMGK